ncbi:MAG: hypothetical protein MHM6MM_004407 [Cercozoa sp. M6MM]
MYYFILHKPRGVLSSRKDGRGLEKKTLYDVIDGNVFPHVGHVGRLDEDTSGVLLMTDDSLLNMALLSPFFKGNAPPGSVDPVYKVYHLHVAGHYDESADPVQLMRTPLKCENGCRDGTDYFTRPAQIRVLRHYSVTQQEDEDRGYRWLPHAGKRTVLEVRIREGKKRQIRRLARRSRLPVRWLHRVQIGDEKDALPLHLRRSDGSFMEAGECRWLTPDDVRTLYRRILPCNTAPVARSLLHTALNPHLEDSLSRVVADFVGVVDESYNAASGHRVPLNEEALRLPRRPRRKHWRPRRADTAAN